MGKDDNRSWYEKISDGVVELGENIWNEVKDFAVNLWNGIKETGKDIGKFFSDLGQKVFGNTWDKIKDFATDIFNGIKNAGKDIGKFFNGLGETIFGDSWAGIKNAVSDVWDGIKDAGKGIGNFFKEAGQGIGNFFSGLWKSITGRDDFVPVGRDLDGNEIIDPINNGYIEDPETGLWYKNEEDPFVPVGVDLNGNEIINAENEDGLHNWENDELTNNMTQEEKMDFYNSLLNKDLSDEEIKQALAEAGIDYEKDIKTYEGDYNHNATEYEIVHNKQSKEDVFYEKQNINGQEVTTATIFRDANGNITQEERVEYDANGKRIGSTFYLYDTNGRVLQNSETKFDENGKIVSTSDCKTKYDANGNITGSVSIEVKYKDGQLSAENKIEYDKDGNIKTRTTTSNNYDKKGNLISSLVSEYEEDNIAPSAIYITNKDKQGNLITDKIDPKSGKKIGKSMVDPSGNTYNYKADAGTDSGFELTSVTNKSGQTYEINNYVNNDGILDWKKLQQDGWGTSLTGDSAQQAFADLLNGASVDEIIAKYETNTENHAAQKISNNGNNSHYNNPTGYVNYTGNSFYDAGANGWAVGQTGSGLVWQDGNTDPNHFNNWTNAPGMTGSMSQFMEGFMRGRGGGSAGAHY